MIVDARKTRSGAGWRLSSTHPEMTAEPTAAVGAPMVLTKPLLQQFLLPLEVACSHSFHECCFWHMVVSDVKAMPHVSHVIAVDVQMKNNVTANCTAKA